MTCGALDDDSGDIYIMMQFCLSVTKNHHFLKRSVCQPCDDDDDTI